MNENGGGRRITQGDTPTWTPDGRIVYDVPEGIWTVRPDGSERRKLISGDVGEAAWSPDGRRILYTHGADGSRQVYVMNADGSGKTNLNRNSFDEWATDWR